jgi:hypothetical protein
MGRESLNEMFLCVCSLFSRILRRGKNAVPNLRFCCRLQRYCEWTVCKWLNVNQIKFNFLQ